MHIKDLEDQYKRITFEYKQLVAKYDPDRSKLKLADNDHNIFNAYVYLLITLEDEMDAEIERGS